MKEFFLKNKIKTLLLTNLIFGIWAILFWTLFLTNKNQTLFILAITCNSIQFISFIIQLILQLKQEKNEK